MAERIGPELAKRFGDAHEAGMEIYPESTEMDLRNNALGYGLGALPFTREELTKKAMAEYTKYEKIIQTANWRDYIIIERVYKAYQKGMLTLYGE